MLNPNERASLELKKKELEDNIMSCQKTISVASQTVEAFTNKRDRCAADLEAVNKKLSGKAKKSDQPEE